MQPFCHTPYWNVSNGEIGSYAVLIMNVRNSGEKAMSVQQIEAALADSHGRIAGPAGAAAKLRLPRQTLESKIARLGINKHHFKSGDRRR